jgi:ribosomal protein L22
MHRCSPRKLTLVARMINGIRLEEAIRQTRFCAKRPAIRVHALLKQARAVIRQQVYPAMIPDGRKVRDMVTDGMLARADELVSRHSILQAMVGRGPYLKRPDYKAKGRMGVRRRPHAMMRVQFGIVDEGRRVERLLRQTVVIQEHRPAFTRLDY